jgi:glycosyltransferase involved in cell wall biosynthesis
MKPAVSVIVLACNEETNLPDCLKSLARLECEIFVVDSGSTDRTLEIAAASGASVFQHPFENYAKQRNWAQNNLPIRTEWVLHLDSDERLTPELVDEIEQVVHHAPADVDGFLLRRRTVFMGKWIKYGGHYPSFHLRLFRNGKGSCESRLYHQHFLVDGKVRPLRHDFIDVIMSDISVWSLRHIRWAELEARAILDSPVGERLVHGSYFGNAVERRRWLREEFYHRFPLLLRPFLYWVYRYFVRLGFLDGKEGLIFHFLQGFWAQFLVDVKIYEARKQNGAVVESLGSSLR